MINKKLELPTISDLNYLKENSIPESKTIEYKREIPDDNKKIARVICSLANTAGRDLIYGIEAKDGIPSSVILPEIVLDTTAFARPGGLRCGIGFSLCSKAYVRS